MRKLKLLAASCEESSINVYLFVLANPRSRAAGNALAQFNLKHLIILIFILTVCCTCVELGTADLAPGIPLYKTNGDYFDLVDIGMKGDRIFRTDDFVTELELSSGKLIIIDDDTIYRFRKRMTDGFVLDEEADEGHDVFLSLSYKKYLAKQKENNYSMLLLDTLKKYILDKDPYTEFYRNKTEVKRFFISDSAEILKIIKNDSIEYYFNKIK